MFDFLSQIVDFLRMVVGLLVNLVSAVADFMVMIPKYIAFINVSTGYLPSVCLSFILFGFFVSLLLLIIGRN